MSRGLEAGVLEGRDDRRLRLLDEVADEVLELRPGQVDHEVLRPGGVGGDVREVDLGRRGGRQLDLRLLGGLLEALEGLLVLGQVDALVLLELGQQPVDDALVEVVAAQVGVAVRGLDLEHALAQLEDRDVERAAAQVVDRDLLVGLLVEAVREGRRGRLVDDPLDVEAGDPAGVLRRLALGVVEVGGDGDDRLGHLLAQVCLRVRLELLQHHGRDLGRRVALGVGDDLDAVGLAVLLDGVRDEALRALDLGVVPAAAHEALDRVDGVGGVGHRLALGQLADHALAGLGKADDRGDGAVALGARDDGGLAALHHRDDGVRRPEVDADDLAHVRGLSFEVRWVVFGVRRMDQLMGPSGTSPSGGARHGDERRADDPVAQPVAAPDLVDDLAIGAAGPGDAHDGLVLARVERRAGRRLDGGDALALEEQAQLAVDRGDALEPAVALEACRRVGDRAVEVVREDSTLRMRSSPARPASRTRSSAGAALEVGELRPLALQRGQVLVRLGHGIVALGDGRVAGGDGDLQLGEQGGRGDVDLLDSLLGAGLAVHGSPGLGHA